MARPSRMQSKRLLTWGLWQEDEDDNAGTDHAELDVDGWLVLERVGLSQRVECDRCHKSADAPPPDSPVISLVYGNRP